MQTGPFIIIEDDADDKLLLEEIFRELEIKNKLVWFTNCEDAFQYLTNSAEQPFLILSDVNLPGLKGHEFKSKIDCDKKLRGKSIPFVFYSTSSNPRAVAEAYMEMTVQGYFKKALTMQQMKKDIKLIIDYWSVCLHPNSQS